MLPFPAQTPRRILLIDDEKSVLHALKLLLEALGHQVTTFFTPSEALTSLKDQANFDIVFCDLRMPEMNGIEVIAEIKRLCPTIPAVLMSAHATNEEVEQGKAAGTSAFLGKPFTPNEFAEVLKDLTSSRVNIESK